MACGEMLLGPSVGQRVVPVDRPGGHVLDQLAVRAAGADLTDLLPDAPAQIRSRLAAADTPFPA